MDPQDEIIADSEDEGHDGMAALEHVGGAESPAPAALPTAIGSAHLDTLASPRIDSALRHQQPRPGAYVYKVFIQQQRL
jgi:hypothetical protein